MNLNNKKILIGVTGSIAAYKAADLVSKLRKQGAEVRVLITQAGQQFITPLTMQTLSGNVVQDDMFVPATKSGLEHIKLARWADLVVVAPASANFIARVACGMADDLLSTVCLATTGKIVVVPAMNKVMWGNQITQHNVKILERHGVTVFSPAKGEQACGEKGAGRMLEPMEILEKLNNLFLEKVLKGKSFLITAGPTHEALDPVRFLGNRSSGKMGFALAEVAADMGANVTLISGPVDLPTPMNVKRINITTALEMYNAVFELVKEVDVFISVAAVADYRPANENVQKIKKSSEKMKLDLVRNPDILATVAKNAKKPLLIGFAAETSALLTNARKKLKKKKIDVIVANKVGKDCGFGSDVLEAIICKSNGATIDLPLGNKKKIAQQILLVANEML